MYVCVYLMCVCVCLWEKKRRRIVLVISPYSLSLILHLFHLLFIIQATLLWSHSHLPYSSTSSLHSPAIPSPSSFSLSLKYPSFLPFSIFPQLFLLHYHLPSSSFYLPSLNSSSFTTSPPLPLPQSLTSLLHPLLFLHRSLSLPLQDLPLACTASTTSFCH